MEKINGVNSMASGWVGLQRLTPKPTPESLPATKNPSSPLENKSIDSLPQPAVTLPIPQDFSIETILQPNNTAPKLFSLEKQKNLLKLEIDSKIAKELSLLNRVSNEAQGSPHGEALMLTLKKTLKGSKRSWKQ